MSNIELIDSQLLKLDVERVISSKSSWNKIKPAATFETIF